MSQKARIISHLKRGPLTPVQALHLYGCMRLAARVQELRDSGFPIQTQIVERDGKRFAKYWLIKRTRQS